MNPRWNFLLSEPHVLLLLWLTLLGLVVFASVVGVDQSLVQMMVEADQSRICIVLILMYVVGVAHTFKRTLYLSRELNRAVAIASRIMRGEVTAGALRTRGDAHAAGLPAGFVVDYLADHHAARSVPDAPSDLLDAYASRLRGAHEFGWYYIDMMLKVGFLGTLVGFILMLSSVTQSGTLDASTMQKVLQQMSVGMSTALYTTLASLVAGILLSVPYYLLDRGLEALLQVTVHIKEVLLAPVPVPAV
ncbi:MAG: MotA/TolQ/ExbB proton channel family protein [Gammaproteobacteria bacterium]|nr:MotA/TolQ/ExbB proton channel family protein [Gammaproteobacteria bacterium]